MRTSRPMTITLPPELKQVIEDQAQKQGTTPELLVVDGLRGLFMPVPTPAPPSEGLTMADFFTGYVGGLHSSEFVPGGAHLSEDTGRKFKELLLKKHRKGKEAC